MRIISKFKDFYDGGAAFGIDQERVYVRETCLIDEPTIRHIGYNIIGFCGKLYAFNSELPYYPDGNYDYNPKELTLFGDELIDYKFKEDKVPDGQFATKIIYKKVKCDWDKPKPKWYKTTTRNQYIEEIKKAENNKELLGLFVKYKTPIFWYGFGYTYSRVGNILINPNLKMLGFQKVMDTVTAFQELEMFMGSVLVQDSYAKQPVGNDEVIGTSKGFDRYSFRNVGSKNPKKF